MCMLVYVEYRISIELDWKTSGFELNHALRATSHVLPHNSCFPTTSISENIKGILGNCSFVADNLRNVCVALLQILAEIVLCMDKRFHVNILN